MVKHKIISNIIRLIHMLNNMNFWNTTLPPIQGFHPGLLWIKYVDETKSELIIFCALNDVQSNEVKDFLPQGMEGMKLI